ncbi:splicing factor u2af 65 kda subunit [Anaeramoeba flamelloides]|uniref:Splicing factor u2af 65 kDa subunit n=1 Tax=Anaeramoeba flamelloides TaxID=1746091 RepID=A0ABQ8Z0R2_9EUKA|nr:splicing factor u2af 65 kda subunit [Anaeramoeba flamelloides]
MNEKPRFLEQRSWSDQNQQYPFPNKQTNSHSENHSTENKRNYQNQIQNYHGQNRSENRYDQQKRNSPNEGTHFRDNSYQTNTREKRVSSFNNDYNRENKNPENVSQSQLENENRPRSSNRNTRWGKRHRQRNEQTSNYQQRSQQMRQNFNQNNNNDEFSENNPRFNRYKRDSRDRRENFSNRRDENRSRNNYSKHRYHNSYDQNTRNENLSQKRYNSFNKNNWNNNQQTNNFKFNNEYPQQQKQQQIQEQQQQQQFNNLRPQTEQSQYPNTRNNQNFSGTNNSSKELYIGNIPPFITPKELINFINQALTIRKIVSGFNSATNARLTKSKKAAFVGFKNEQIATEALKLDGVKIENNVLRIARPIGYQEKIVTSNQQTQQNYQQPQNVNNQSNQNEIYIGGLDKEINKQDLLTILSKCGEINNLRLITDNSLNYGLVEFKTEEQAKNACQLLNDQIFYNSKLIVCPSSSVSHLKNIGNSNQIPPKSIQPNNLQRSLTSPTILQQNQQATVQNQNNFESSTGNSHQILNPYLLSKLQISDILNFNIPFTIKSSETKVDSIQNVNPTPIVVLYNIINKKILQNEQLCQNNLIEILKQASNYGIIEEIYFPRRLNNPQDTQLKRHFGKIFLKYSSINGAIFMIKELSKKVFNSRTCIVSFFQEKDYQNLSQQFPKYIILYKNNNLIFPQQYQNQNQQNKTQTQNLNQNPNQFQIKQNQILQQQQQQLYQNQQNQTHIQNKDQIQNQQDLNQYRLSQNHTRYENTPQNKNKGKSLYDNPYKN